MRATAPSCAPRAKASRFDEGRIAAEARYDGKWVLSTNTNLDAADMALKYKQLWMVQDLFRTTKSLLRTRPIFHHLDETIRGHVFCSFLALVLRKALQDRLDAAGHHFKWADVLQDLRRLEEVDVVHQGKHFVLRTQAQGTAGKVFQAVGVALPPTIRQVPMSSGNQPHSHPEDKHPGATPPFSLRNPLH